MRFGFTVYMYGNDWFIALGKKYITENVVRLTVKKVLEKKGLKFYTKEEEDIIVEYFKKRVKRAWIEDSTLRGYHKLNTEYSGTLIEDEYILEV